MSRTFQARADIASMRSPSQLEVSLFWALGIVVAIASGGVAVYAPGDMLPRLCGLVDGPARPALDHRIPKSSGKYFRTSIFLGHRQGAPERERSHAEDRCSDHR